MLGIKKEDYLNKYYISKGNNKAIIFKPLFLWNTCLQSVGSEHISNESLCSAGSGSPCLFPERTLLPIYDCSLCLCVYLCLGKCSQVPHSWLVIPVPGGFHSSIRMRRSSLGTLTQRTQLLRFRQCKDQVGTFCSTSEVGKGNYTGQDFLLVFGSSYHAFSTLFHQFYNQTTNDRTSSPCRRKYGKEMFQLLVSKKTHPLTLLLCYYRPVLLHEGVAEWPLLDLTLLQAVKLEDKCTVVGGTSALQFSSWLALDKIFSLFIRYSVLKTVP